MEHSAKRWETTDNGLQTPGRQSQDSGQRSVVSGPESARTLCALRFAIFHLRKSAVKII